MMKDEGAGLDVDLAEELFGQAHHEAQKQKRLSDEERKAVLLACREILKTGPGKSFVYYLINQTGVFACTFTGNSGTFYLEGRRSVGLDLYRLFMEADPYFLQNIVDYRKKFLQGAEHE